jgi:hypothetical protein
MMENYSEYYMECEPTMDGLWDTSEDMIDDSFPETNTGFDETASFSSGQDIVSPPQSYPQTIQISQEIENTLDDLLEMPLYDLYDTTDAPGIYEEDIPVTGFDTIGIVTPRSSGKPTYQGQLRPTVSPDARTSNEMKNHSSNELNAQYTQAVARFAASMRRSEATRSEILRQKLLVRNMSEFNAGVDSRSQLWSAMSSSQPVRNQC